MAYNELIKNFEKIRFYMRDFYIYGFRSREEYNIKSLRSYDNERRRIESFLYEYMTFKRKKSLKNIYISIDSRTLSQNPFYKSLKSKTFTNKDITLHFIIFDILHDISNKYTVKEITDRIHNEYLNVFKNPMIIDEATVRNKLNEYVDIQIIRKEKINRKIYYSKYENLNIKELEKLRDIIKFFSEVSVCGVIGSFILDKINNSSDFILYKHHYITQALDSEVLYNIFDAISEKRGICFKSYSKRTKQFRDYKIVPLRVAISVQNGRQYVLGYDLLSKNIKSYRIDYIKNIKKYSKIDNFDEIRSYVLNINKYIWGAFSERKKLNHIEFIINVNENENYIYERLEREKRCGRVQKLTNNLYKFSADIYDIYDIIPWIRTFIGRITSINFSDKKIEQRFKEDIQNMYKIYNIDEELE